MKIKIALATIVAAAAFAAPAQAQDDVICFDGTGTTLDGKCIQDDRLDRICYGGRCIEGVWSNVESALEMINNLPYYIDDFLPDRVCTPNLLSGPVCVTG